MTKAAAKDKSSKQIDKLTLIARGRVNLDFASELQVTSKADNVIKVEKESRYFDETLAHVCARVTKYVDELELLRGDQLIAKVTCDQVPREKVKINKKSTTEIYLDEVEAARNFTVTYLSSETNKLESETKETKVRSWKYRRDERRNQFIDQLKEAINKVDNTLVSIRQASTMTQEEIDLQAEIKKENEALKAKRKQLANLKADRKAAAA
ncbi:MAG: hypothetical protein ACYTFW_00640 [Planctomycetota bacterium]|jgi:hypothetical protein